MKKIVMSLAIAAVAAAGFSSCNKGGNYAPEDKNFGDSIAVALGEFAGAQQQQQFVRMMQDSVMSAKMNKADFLRGMQTVLSADTSDMAYVQGLQFGVQLMQPIMGITTEAGLPVDPDLVVKAFKQVFEQDSLAEPQKYYTAYQTLMGELRERMEAKAKEAKANSEEAKRNLKEGQAYIQEMAKKDGYMTSESGIVYNIENPGVGPKVQPTDRVDIRYIGKHVNGEVFDQTKDEPYNASGSAFIPGFNEALSMLGKGGKMQVIIPADQAYGLDGAGANIGPNECLVFDIEVVNIQPRVSPTPAKK